MKKFSQIDEGVSGAAVKRAIADHPKYYHGFGGEGWEFHQGHGDIKHKLIYRTSDTKFMNQADKKVEQLHSAGKIQPNEYGLNHHRKQFRSELASEHSAKKIKEISASLTKAGIKHTLGRSNEGDANKFHHVINIG